MNVFLHRMLREDRQSEPSIANGAATKELEQLEILVAEVRNMRGHQRDYFAARRRGESGSADLIAAKRCEGEVDRLLAELDAPEPKQGGLF